MAIKNAAELTKYLAQRTNIFEGVLSKVKILSVGNGKLQAELKIEEQHTNPMGGLHGGFSATLVDCLSTYALMSTIEEPNVSVDIHMKYLKGAGIGDDILINASVIKTGKTLSFLQVDILNKQTGDLLVQGSHTKFIKR